MKTKLTLGLLVLVIITNPHRTYAQGTGFTYQGRLNNNGAAVSGTYNVKFTLFNTNSGGVAVAGPVTNLVAGVTNGLFTTTIDFGADVFTGNNEWLELGVRTNGNGGFMTLTPRQPVTPTPYAITAENLAGAITVRNNINNVPNIIGGSPENYVSSAVEGATIAGGGTTNYGGGFTYTNSVTSDFGTVSGGLGNTASGFYSTVPGGIANTAGGTGSFAAGYQAKALFDYSFVWSDGGGDFSSTAQGQFAVRAFGGVRLVGNVTMGDLSLSENGPYHHLSMSGGNSTGYLYGAYNYGNQDGIQLGYNFYADAAGTPHIINTGGGTSRIIATYGEIELVVGGVNVSPNTVRLDATTTGVTVTGTFNNSSDRNAKQDFAAVSPSQILDKVLQLPVSEWSYKTDAATRHIGPMAQDFSSVFNIGTDDKHIAPIDEGGVAFAAIQGLNQKLQEELKRRDAENVELKTRLDKLEKLMNKMNGGAK